jgi:mercuric ion transport protein
MSHRWKQGLLPLPGIGVSLLPKLVCPLFWPAYAGLLSSIGLGFLVSAAYLLPAMVFRANNRHGYGPLLLGLVAATGVLFGKFAWESNPTMSGAVGLLVVASVWNAWPHRTEASACSNCDKNLDQRRASSS